jgi:hypothetical protein
VEKKMSNNLMDKSRIRSTHEFKDESGNVIEKRLYNKFLELKSIYKYEYDAKNLLIKETRYTSEEEIRYLIKYIYDENGNLIEYVAYDADGKPSYKKVYMYKNNILVEEKGYNLGVELRYKTLFYYDADGYKIVEHNFNSENKLNFVSVFERDGNLYEVISPTGKSIIKISRHDNEVKNSITFMKTEKYKTCSNLDDVETQYELDFYDEIEE